MGYADAMKPRDQARLLDVAARSILLLVVVAAMSMSVAFVYGNNDDLGNCVDPFQAGASLLRSR